MIPTYSQTVQWIIIFYVGSRTGLPLSLGHAADQYGRKRFYLMGVSIPAAPPVTTAGLSTLDVGDP